jgi:hypothetical protein
MGPNLEKLFGGPRPKSPEEAVVEYVALTGVFEGVTDDPKKKTDGFVLQWRIRGFGWGEFTFTRTYAEGETAQYECDSEMMDKEWVRVVWNAFFDKFKLRD